MSLELIERSLEQVGDPTAQVYARLFAEFPETEERFCRDTTGSIRAEMLTMVFDCLMDPGGPYQANLVRAERVNHDGFGTPNEVFDRFFWIVLETCRESWPARRGRRRPRPPGSRRSSGSWPPRNRKGRPVFRRSAPSLSKLWV